MSGFNSKGFTLLEVLVAIGLLAFLSLGIFSLTTNSWDVNSKLSAESADVTSMLLSLQAVETDLEQIYTPRLGALTVKPEDTNKLSDYWSPPVRSDGFRRSRFKGDNNKLTFVTNNNRRVEADSPESDFVKVAWEVERNSKGTYTLYRSRDADAFRYEDGTAKKAQRCPNDSTSLEPSKARGQDAARSRASAGWLKTSDE